MAELPFNGLRVLDFTHVLAGPFATRILGDLGADVVKIMSEARHGPDGGTSSPYHAMWNRSKRVLQLDMTQPDARLMCANMCKRADIVIDNFSPGVLDRWGIGYEVTSIENPGVIYIQMSGMGDSGPWSSYVSFAPTVHALAGLTYLTGVPGREDIGIGFSYNDHQSGLHGTVALLAALIERRKSGIGQRIELSQFEVGTTFNAPALLDFFANQSITGPSGNQLPFDQVAPHNCYPCLGTDRWIAIAIMGDDQWTKLIQQMGAPNWAIDPSLAHATGRVENQNFIDEQIKEWTQSQIAEDLMILLQTNGIPAGVVQTGEDLVEKDPQLASSDFIFEYDDEHPTLGKISGDRLPLHFEDKLIDKYSRPEIFGESNRQILKDWLDMTDDDINLNIQSGLIK